MNISGISERKSESPEIIKTDVDEALESQIKEARRVVEAEKTLDYEDKRRTKYGLAPLSTKQREAIEKRLESKKDISKAVGKTRQIILMMVYDEMSLTEIAPVLGFSVEMITLVASSPLFRAELEKEILAKAKLYREGALSDLSDRVVTKFSEIIEKGEIVFKRDDGSKHTIYIKGRDFIDMGKTVLEMSGHGHSTKQIVTHDHSSLSEAIIQAHKEMEKADEEGADGEVEIIDAEVILPSFNQKTIEAKTKKEMEEAEDIEGKLESGVDSKDFREWEVALEEEKGEEFV